MPKKTRALNALIILTLAMVACGGLAGNAPTSTPTAIPLAAPEGPTPSPTLRPQPELTPVPKAVAGTATPAPEAVPGAPAEATATSTPLAPPAMAPTATPTAVRIMALGNRLSLSLRGRPDAAAPAIAELPGSEVLWALARSADGRWLRVAYGQAGAQAWAASADLILLGEADSLPVWTSEASVSLTQPPPAESQALPGRVVSGPLNVRSGPGVDQSVLGQLAAGDTVTVIGRSEEGDWLAIAWSASTAWVAARYVEVSGDLTGLPALAPATTAARPSAPARPGKVAFQTSIGGDIYLVNADGSGLRRVATGLDPALSPDGTRLAYARWDAPHGVFVLDLRTGEEQRVATANRPRSPTWSPDGTRLVFSYYTRTSSCIVTPFGCFDEDTVRELLGGEECIDTPQGRYCISDFPLRRVDASALAQVTLTDGAWLDLPSEPIAQSPQFHPSWDEVLYRGSRGLQITAPEGTSRELAANQDLGSPAWSPDGQRIAVQIQLHDHADIFLLDAAGNVQQRLTAPAFSFDRPSNNVAPAWSPDGRFILFLSDRDGSWRLYRMNADGSNQVPFLPDTLSDLTFRYDFAAERVVSWGR